MPDEPKLILKRAHGPARIEDDYDVLSAGEVVGRIFKSPMAKPCYRLTGLRQVSGTTTVPVNPLNCLTIGWLPRPYGRLNAPDGSQPIITGRRRRS
jgi:hypothetical protein